MTEWIAQAACARPGADPDDWFPTSGSRPEQPKPATVRALATCRGCPVRTACRDDMLADARAGRRPAATIRAGWWWPLDRYGTVRPHSADRALHAALVRSGS